ncbi:C2 family cysteine protease [Brevibacterium sp. CS2]|uniref:C2 family cysteine protease n=1 Tax=Brevibacterium sp. CS2 TaxID=2575923 RepID=UPI0010C799A6|nr:C2 family cysteine protease [Brevibacterium sp. CS2]QCP03951.1 hypothetical protein FDF13_00310 [Brevibacterium sp. CS2]
MPTERRRVRRPRSVRARRAEDLRLLRTLLAVDPLPRADLGALSAELRPARGRSSSLTGRLRSRLRIDDRRGPRLLAAAHDLSAAEVARALNTVPALEPVPRGPARWVPVPLRGLTAPGSAAARPAEGERNRPVRPLSIRQGRLSDCWFIAVLAACEHMRPGFTASLVRPTDNGLVEVRLHTPGARWVTLSPRVPAAHRAGDRRLRPNAASLVEKAAALTYGRGSYRRIQGDFAGVALGLLTGRWCPARPVPLRLSRIEHWLAAGRPVVASTLVRPGGSFRVPREDDPHRSVAVMDGHVYVVRRVARLSEDGSPDPHEPLRVHVHNPLGGTEGEPRRTDLFLSAAQLRRTFISVNVGPRLR